MTRLSTWRADPIFYTWHAQFDQLVRYATDEYDCGAVDWDNSGVEGQTDARGRFSSADAKAHRAAVSAALVPTIVVAARSDPVFRIEAAREMASAFRAEVVAVDGGHILSAARRDAWLGRIVEHWRANNATPQRQ